MSSIERPGRVIAVQQTRGIRYAQIRLDAAPSCAGCGSRGQCGAGNERGQVVSLPVKASVMPGELVTVSLPESVVPRAALLGYFVPVLGVLIGALLAHGWLPNDLTTVAGAVIGLAAGVAAVRLLVTLSGGRGLQPTLCATVPRQDALLPSGDHS